MSVIRRRLVVLAALSLTLVTSAGPVMAHSVDGVPRSGGSVSANARAQAEQLTSNLASLTAQYQLAGASQRAALESQMLQLAIAREQTLSAMLEDDPAEFLRVALPSSIRASLPASVQARTEEEADVDGTLEVLHEDGVSYSRYNYFLDTILGKLTLKYAAEAPELRTGTRVRVPGVRLGQMLAVGGGGSTKNLAAATPPNTFGAQKTLVMLVNFTDNATEPYTVDFAKGVVFTTTSNFDMENSYGQTWLTGDVVGWYTIPVSGSVCDYNSIATYAKQAAAAAGVDVSSYTRHVFAFPDNACSWWGLGTVGGNPSRAWINGSFELAVVGHEMGHNFGLYHSHSWDCGTVVLGGSCTLFEYGDRFDIMGGSSSNHFNAFQKERLGWLNYGSSPGITTVTTSGTYTIDPYETLGGMKALKILQDSTSNTYYYLEYRQPIGFDASVGTYANIVNGVIARTGSASSPDSSRLLDMTPATSSWYDPALVTGLSYYDPVSGITITPVWTNSTNAGVTVSFGPMQCVKTTPTISISPSQSQWVAPGTTVTYTVTVTNTDNSGCTSSTFDVTASVPAGWSVTYGGSPVTIAPGTSGSATINVTAPAGTAGGFSTIDVTATDGTRSISTSATYVIGSALNVGVTSDQTTYTANRTAIVTTTVQSNGSPVSAASVAVTITRANGSTTNLSATTGADGKAVVKYRFKRQDPAGMYQATSNATVNGGAAIGSASTSFMMQ